MKHNKTAGLIGVLVFSASVAVQAAIMYSTNSVAPGANVLVSYDVGGTQSMSARNKADTSTDRTVGQTFKLGSNATVSKITVTMGNSATFATGTQVLQLAISKDTNADGTADTAVGSVSSYDLAGFGMTADGYITFEFNPLSIAANTTYQFEFGWQEDGANTWDDNTQNFSIRRTTSGTYADGGQVSKSNYTGIPNTLVANGTNDLNFYVQGTVIPEPATLGLVAAFGGGILLIRRRFMM